MPEDVVKELEVSLDVGSRFRSLRDLVKLVGIAPSIGSHDRGGQRSKSSKWGSARLRIPSPLLPTASIDAHIGALLEIVPEIVEDDVDLTLTVALLFDDPTVSFRISASQLGRIALREWSMDLSVYPCAEEAEISERD
jgi:hypothetical protein